MGFLGQLFSAQNNYNQTAPQTNYNAQLQSGLGQTQNAINQEQSLASALQQQMQGGGPNLGQTQLQGATDRANAQAAGLIGSQRGLSPALAARQILNQQAANTQGASNQSAQLQQQQQLAAQQQLAGVLGQQGQLANQQIGTLGGLQQGQNALNQQAQLANQGASNQFFGAGGAGGTAGGLGQAVSGIAGLFHKGGKVDAMVSPGEMIVPPGGNYDDGGIVPGNAPVDGDSLKNDVVPAKLPVGSVVVPRSVTGGGGPNLNPQKVADFISALKGNQPSGYGRVLAAKQKTQQAQ
jgi:hypothetical protein